MDASELSKLAYTMGVLTGMLGRDAVKDFLKSKGASESEIKELEGMLVHMANVFYR